MLTLLRSLLSLKANQTQNPYNSCFQPFFPSGILVYIVFSSRLFIRVSATLTYLNKQTNPSRLNPPEAASAFWLKTLLSLKSPLASELFFWDIILLFLSIAPWLPFPVSFNPVSLWRPVSQLFGLSAPGLFSPFPTANHWRSLGCRTFLSLLSIICLTDRSNPEPLSEPQNCIASCILIIFYFADSDTSDTLVQTWIRSLAARTFPHLYFVPWLSTCQSTVILYLLSHCCFWLPLPFSSLNYHAHHLSSECDLAPLSTALPISVLCLLLIVPTSSVVVVIFLSTFRLV